MMIVSSIIAMFAGFCSSCAFIPQVLKTYYSQSTKGISVYWLLYVMTGASLWIIYGYLEGDYSLLACNAFIFFCVLCIAFMKYRAST